ncbi:MAG: hypothetical protein ACOVKO_10305 [Elstera sp.]
MSVFEIVEFSLKPGITTEAFLATVPATETLCRAAPGFRQRWLTQGEEGRWTDIVEWADLQTAQQAAATLVTAPGFAAFGGAIDGPSVVMRHTHLRVAIL